MLEEKPKTCPFKYNPAAEPGDRETYCSEDCGLYIDDRSIEKAGRCAFFWLTLKLQDIGGSLESLKEILNTRLGKS